MPQTFEVRGLKELDQALAAVPEAFRRRIVLGALRRAARPILNEARARARRGAAQVRRGGVRVGSKQWAKWNLGKPLADSITVSASRNDAEGTVSVAIGPDSGHFYSLFVEEGTKARPAREGVGRVTYERRSKSTGALKLRLRRKRRAKKAHAATRAYPFLQPAFEAHAERTITAIGDEMWQGILTATARLSARAVAGKLTAREIRAFS